jgi:hypothetical protein
MRSLLTSRKREFIEPSCYIYVPDGSGALRKSRCWLNSCVLRKYNMHLNIGLMRHYATNRKVEGSIPNEVTGFLNLPNPSSSCMALGSTSSNRNVCQVSSWGVKGSWHVRLIVSPTYVTRLSRMNVVAPTLWSSTACYRDSFIF